MLAGIYKKLKSLYYYKTTSAFFEIIKKRSSPIFMEALVTLIADGIDIDAQDDKGNTPLHWAVRQGYPEIIQLLIDNGANVNAQNNEGNAPLHLATTYVDTEMQRRIYSEANFNTMFSLQNIFALNTKLFRQRAIQLLLHNGANCETQNNNGDTPLHRADESTLLLLLEQVKTADIQNNRGQTLLHMTITHRHTISSQILNKMTKLDLQDFNGNTPLHLTMCHQKYTLAKQLLERGAKIDTLNIYGKSPFMFMSFSFQPNEHWPWGLIDILSILLNKIHEAQRFEHLCEALEISAQTPEELLNLLMGYYGEDALKKIKIVEEQYTNTIALRTSDPSPLLGQLLALCEEATMPSASAASGVTPSFASSSREQESSSDNVSFNPFRTWCRCRR
ncbi:ankyrin repeat domain-containing protein [Candidatus Berkiella aquae]|uniref:Ankyrin repeat domain-containing protein n=1 Tax=Candidatus Berkiella aquae TaxID=295108 RepID=A0A0Q9YW96_9GAMM|nr:ankyrin repeat domain-containing protein [Candidatus Berkiella aquae]MCS5711374.1 ankyrin repeat domain-containing protein [Candidatus Berkiella aquae]